MNYEELCEKSEKHLSAENELRGDYYKFISDYLYQHESVHIDKEDAYDAEYEITIPHHHGDKDIYLISVKRDNIYSWKVSGIDDCGNVYEDCYTYDDYDTLVTLADFIHEFGIENFIPRKAE